MNFTSWRPQATALPRASTFSSSQTVVLNLYGNGLEVKESLLTKAKRVAWRNRWLFCGAGVALCASAVIGDRWGGMTRAAIGAGALAFGALAAQETSVVPDFVEAAVAEALDLGNDVMVGGETATERIRQMGEETARDCKVGREWSVRLRLHFGFTRDTPADRIVYARWLAEEMSKADMRYTDQAKFIPTVIELSLIPDAHAVEAEMVRRSRVAAAMRAAVPSRPA